MRIINKVLAIAGTGALAAACTVGVAGTASATPPAPHSTLSVHTQAAGKKMSPDAESGCVAYIDKPFFLTTTGPLYAQAQWGGCTVPPPPSCRLKVALAKDGPYGSYLVTSWADTGWGPCAGAPLDKGYKCQGRSVRNTFWAEASLAAEGGTTDVGSGQSLTVGCG